MHDAVASKRLGQGGEALLPVEKQVTGFFILHISPLNGARLETDLVVTGLQQHHDAHGVPTEHGD